MTRHLSLVLIVFGVIILGISGIASLSISDSTAEEEQLELVISTVFKNKIATLTIQNPEDSVDDVYAIKFKVDGKIVKFSKLKDWKIQRVDKSSVMYTTTSSPLEPDKKIKISLNIDSKKSEIQWEAFSEGQENLGTGIIKIKTEQTTQKENSQKTSTTTSVFPDPNTDPRYYLKRYYSEPKYKEWFDKNYPNVSIEEKVRYPAVIIQDNAYVNNLFGFSIVPPSGWEKTENPKTVDEKFSGIVGFISNLDSKPCDYRAKFIIHYTKDKQLSNSVTSSYLLNIYEDVIYFPEASQTKLIDKKITKIPNGYKLNYVFNDVSYFPEIIGDDGTKCAEEFTTLQNEYVIFLYNNGDSYDIIFSAEPQFYDKSITEWQKSISSFKIGKKFEKLSTILNYNK